MNFTSFARPLSVVAGVALCLGLLANGITRETPMGGLQGTILMKENARPLVETGIELRPISINEKNVDAQWLPTDDSRHTYRIESDEKGKYRLTNVEAGDYEISIASTAHRMKSTYLHIAEGKAQTQDFELEPVEPYLNLYSSQHVFTPKEKVEFSATGFGKGDSLKIEAFRLNPNGVLNSSSLYAALSPLARPANAAQRVDPATIGQRIQIHEPKIVSRDLEGIFNERLQLDTLKEGLYWVQVNFGDQTQGSWFSVSKFGLVTKEAEGDLLVFASDLESGKAIAGVQIGYANAGAFRQIGVTGASGLMRAHLDANQKSSGVLMGIQGESRSFVDLTVTKPADAQLKMLVYTDRPVYRPGDEVQFKGVVRSLKDNDYTIPSGRQVEIEVRDADATLIDKMTLPVSGIGSFHGSIKLNRESKPGSFQIQTSYMDDNDSASFEVAEYRKPEFSIKVEPIKKYYLRGDNAQVQIECEYFFGGPVQNAEVEAYITRAPVWDYGPLDEEYEDYGSAESYGGEYVATIKARTDSSGRAIITFPTNQYPDPNVDEDPTDAVYGVQASVTESSGKFFDGEGSVKVIRSDVAARVKMSRYVVRPNEAFDAEIQTYNPVDDAPIANQKVDVEAGYNVWKGATSSFVPFAKETVTTDANGKVVMSISPKRGGELEVRAHVSDAGGRSSTNASYAYVDKRGDWYGDPPAIGNALSLRLDQKSYNPGDTAKLVIETDQPGATALITVEADKLISTQVVQLNEAVTLMDLPVRPEHAPTAFVEAVFIKNKKFVSAQRRLSVDLTQKKLKISIDSDKANYQPGETARYTLRAQDENGKPVVADLSFGLVDESIYAIMPDTTDIVSSFYPKRYNSVQTRFSFEEIYLDGGDKAPKNITIRKRFRDTAYWNPSVTTNAQGVAHITTQLPDNLTTWRATTIGMTASSQVGQATQQVKARKDLMVRIEAPSFLVQKDSQRVQALVTNDSDADADVHVEFAAENVKLIGDAKQSKRIAKGATATFEWTFEASSTGAAKFTAKAWINDNISDGVEYATFVQPHGRLYQETTAGMFSGEEKFNVTVREGADIATGRLRIIATPTLAASLATSIDDLIDFPYGCVEQTMSRFLPTVLVTEAVAKAGLPKPKRAEEMPRMVAEGLVRLRNMQHSDGGWGWWDFDSTDEFMTGYVLEGLARAKQAGFAPDETMVERGVKNAQESLKSTIDALVERDRRENPRRPKAFYEYTRNRLVHARAQLLVGVAAAAPEALTDANFVGVEPKADDAASMAALAMAANLSHRPQLSAQWLGRLRDAATETAGLMSWNEGWGIENTARGLQALIALSPNDPGIERIVRYLLTKRRGDMWWSTRDTSAALVGLTAYLSQTKELTTGGELTVDVNGERVASINVDPNNLNSPDQIIEIPFNRLKQGSNEVTVRRSGGTAYYTSDMRQVVVQNDIGALASFPGVQIKRDYFKLGETKLENGTLTVAPGESNIDSVQNGDLVKVVLTLKADAPCEYLIVEDPIPSSCRINDRGAVDSESDWGWWWSQMVAYDNRMAFFITHLEPGEYKLAYIMRAENPGQANAMPTVVYNMYDPDLRASTPAQGFRVDPK